MLMSCCLHRSGYMPSRGRLRRCPPPCIHVSKKCTLERQLQMPSSTPVGSAKHKGAELEHTSLQNTVQKRFPTTRSPLLATTNSPNSSETCGDSEVPSAMLEPICIPSRAVRGLPLADGLRRASPWSGQPISLEFALVALVEPSTGGLVRPTTAACSTCEPRSPTMASKRRRRPKSSACFCAGGLG